MHSTTNLDDAKTDAGRKSYYKPELDVIRLIAFGMVFFHHVLPRDVMFFGNHLSNPALIKFFASIGNSFGFGLPLFFFLSAYLIATLLILEKQSTQTIHLRSFYIRRILRIWPLFYFGLAIGALYALLWSHYDQFKMIGFYAAFLGNLFFINNHASENPAVALWSLSLEEQFYIVFPILLSVMGVRRTPIIAIGMVVLSLVALFWMGNQRLDVDEAIWTSTLSQLIFFGSGVLLAYFTIGKKVDLSIGVRFLLIIVAFGLMISSAFLFDIKYFGNAKSGLSVVVGYCGVALACVLLILGFLDIRIKFPGWMIYLGKISFGLYVYHFLYLMLVGHVASKYMDRTVWLILPLALIPTILTAMLSYRYLETPFLNLRKRFAFINSRPI
jgi:peptidoglycan/LPS O-acetylase OafA/YrhL